MNWGKIGKIILAVGVGATVPQLGTVLPLDPEQTKTVETTVAITGMIGFLVTKFREGKGSVPKPQDPPKA